MSAEPYETDTEMPTIDLSESATGSNWVNLHRAAPLELVDEEGDGRTLTGRVVPYNVVASVADPPTYQPYLESFAPGAFRSQLSAANRIDVLLNYEHRQGISDIVGRGVSLDERPDGLYGTFRMLSHADGDKALELYHAGVLRGLSTEFAVRKSKTVDGVVQRTDARIGNVALCREFGSGFAGPKASYPGAEVLAVRAISTQAAAAVLRGMIASATKYGGLEPDPLGKLAMRKVVKDLRTLLAKEEGQTIDVNELSAVSEAATAAAETDVTGPAPATDAPVAAPKPRTDHEDLMGRLAAVGVVPVLTRALTRAPWDGNPSRFTDEQYQRSCLVDRDDGSPVKERCSLPVLEPNGDLNVNALGPAAAALAGARGGMAGVSTAMKAAAARKLSRYYRMANMPSPASMTKMMGG